MYTPLRKYYDLTISTGGKSRYEEFPEQNLTIFEPFTVWSINGDHQSLRVPLPSPTSPPLRVYLYKRQIILSVGKLRKSREVTFPIFPLVKPHRLFLSRWCFIGTVETKGEGGRRQEQKRTRESARASFSLDRGNFDHSLECEKLRGAKGIRKGVHGIIWDLLGIYASS